MWCHESSTMNHQEFLLREIITWLNAVTPVACHIRLTRAQAEFSCHITWDGQGWTDIVLDRTESSCDFAESVHSLLDQVQDTVITETTAPWPISKDYRPSSVPFVTGSVDSLIMGYRAGDSVIEELTISAL